MTIASQLKSALADYQRLLTAWETELDRSIQAMRDPEWTNRYSKSDNESASARQQVKTKREELHTLLEQIEQLKHAVADYSDEERSKLATMVALEQRVAELRQQIAGQKKIAAELRAQANRHSPQTLALRQQRIFAYRLAELIKVQREVPPDTVHIYVQLAEHAAAYGLRKETRTLLEKTLVMARTTNSNQSLAELLNEKVKVASPIFRECLTTLLNEPDPEIAEDSQHVEQLTTLREAITFDN